MVVSLCLFILYQSLARIYGGRVVAKLPFEPHPFLARITHRGLSGGDMTDCSMVSDGCDLFILLLLGPWCSGCAESFGEDSR